MITVNNVEVPSCSSITYNNTPVHNVWVCDTSNNTCCKVWGCAIEAEIGCILSGFGGCGKFGLRYIHTNIGTYLPQCAENGTIYIDGTYICFCSCNPVHMCIPITNNSNEPFYIEGSLTNVGFCSAACTNSASETYCSDMSCFDNVPIVVCKTLISPNSTTCVDAYATLADIPRKALSAAGVLSRNVQWLKDCTNYNLTFSTDYKSCNYVGSVNSVSSFNF